MSSAAASVSFNTLVDPGGVPAVRVRRLAEYRPPSAEATIARIEPSAGSTPNDTMRRQPSQRELRGLLVTVLEVLDRRRPTGQLATLLSITDCRALCYDITRPGPRRLLSMRVSAPAPGAVELSATINHAGRVRALVARLELAGQRWHCVLLRLV